MAWRDRHLRALVKSARFSNPEAEDFLLSVLKERRDKIGRYWFNKVNPLENFILNQEEDLGGLEVTFEDLAVTYELEPDATTLYRMEITHRGSTVATSLKSSRPGFILDPKVVNGMVLSYDEHRGTSNFKDHLFKLRIETQRDGAGWSKAVVVWVWFFPETGKFEIVGLEYLD